MSRSAVNYKYINKYGTEQRTRSSPAQYSSSYYVTCVSVSVCACVTLPAWHLVEQEEQ